MFYYYTYKQTYVIDINVYSICVHVSLEQEPKTVTFHCKTVTVKYYIQNIYIHYS